MHIVYLTSEFVTEKRSGGLGTYLCNISQIMRDYGHKVTIITLSEQNGRISFRDNIEVVRVKERKCYSGKNSMEDNLSRLINSWNMNRCLKKEAKRQKIDIVQAANYQAVGFFRNRRIPTIVRVSSDSGLWRNAAKCIFSLQQCQIFH